MDDALKALAETADPYVLDVIKIPNFDYDDKPNLWPYCPVWLQEAWERKEITPEFYGEDYWYFNINGALARPDDYVVSLSDNTIACMTDGQINRAFLREKLPLVELTWKNAEGEVIASEWVSKDRAKLMQQGILAAIYEKNHSEQ